MRVNDIMTPDVVTILPEASIGEAIHLMLDKHISGLPVVTKSGQLVGMVTEGDFLRRAEIATERRRARWIEFLMGPGQLANEYVHTHSRKVSEVMSSPAIAVTPDTALENVVSLMAERRVKRLPVIRNDKVVGIVSRANLLTALAAIPTPKANGSDDAIRDKILRELDTHLGGSANSNVQVRDGIVDLWGTVFASSQREAIRVAAENVPGVKAVHDHMVWVEPYSGSLIEAPPPTA